jgi:hypothetical protein
MADEEKASEQSDPQEKLRQALEKFTTDSAEMLGEIGQAAADVKATKEALLKDQEELTKAKDEAAKSTEKIQEFYASLFEKSEGKDKPIVKAIPEAEKSIIKSKEKIDALEASVTTYVEALLGKTGPDGLPVLGIKDDLETKAKDLKDLHSKIFDKPDPNRLALSEEVGAFLEDFTKKKSELESIRKEIIGYQDALLGSLQDDGQRVDGIKGQVAKYIEELDKLIEYSTSTQDRLRERAEKMLQAASTASLASASADQKLSFNTMNIVWLVVLGLAIGAIMGAPFIDFAKAFGHSAGNGAQQSTEVAWYVHWLMRLPFIGGAVWLGLYASKQRSQNKRLQQEYAYKETVAKIYYVLKQEIEELEKVEESAAFARVLKVRIMRILANSVEHNPSVTLDSKAHDDKGPLHEGFEKGFDAFKSVAEAAVKWRK